jgi:uncharacterized membrane protein (DUF2068 family)
MSCVSLRTFYLPITYFSVLQQAGHFQVTEYSINISALSTLFISSDWVRQKHFRVHSQETQQKPVF